MTLKVNNKVIVTKDGYNASDFNDKSMAYNGVYSIKNWDSIIFTIGTGYKLWKSRFNNKKIKCYPLIHNNNVIGYVYETALKIMNK